MPTSTKFAIAQSFKNLAVDNHLNKITIKDITDDCSINRQTFYYHFHDIYDLVEWIYTIEASKVIGEKKTYNTWQQGFLHIFSYVFDNKNFVLRTFHSINREILNQSLYDATYDLLIDVINEKSQSYTVKEEEKSFIANFYKYGFVGLMIDWINGGMKESPNTIIDRLNILISGDIEKALSRFSTPEARLTKNC